MLDHLVSALEELVDTDPAALGDGKTVVELHRRLARLEALVTRAVAAFDAGGEWAVEGAHSAAAWVSVSARVPRESCRRRVRLGRELRHLPATESAWLGGEVGVAQVSALAGVRRPATEEALARDEAMLVDQARTLRPDQFGRVVSYWAQRADAEGAEDEAQRLVDSRRFHLSQTFGGRWMGDLVLDPVSGTIVSNQLSRIEAEMFEADRAEARARVGDTVLHSDLARTPAQRRADALVEMATRAGAAPADARRPEPLFSVVVGYETLAGTLCELADGTVVTPGTLVGWLDKAWIERVVMDGPSRVIDVGVTRRLFAGATRRAVEIRDRECFHPLCDLPARRCEIDHVVPWAAGGPTTVDNGRLACGFHNRQRQRGP